MLSLHRISLRFWLPALVTMVAVLGGLAGYGLSVRAHQRQFESEFVRDQMLHATRIQGEVARWVQRDDLDTVQTLFAELGVFPELKAAVFLDASDRVLASTRRDALERAFAPVRLVSDPADVAALFDTMRNTRRSLRAAPLLSRDQNTLVACLPEVLPVTPGSLESPRGGLVLISYDLRRERALAVAQLRKGFLTYLADIGVIALVLGLSLHVLITRRLRRLDTAMADFADGKRLPSLPARGSDEIAGLVQRFNDMAGVIRKTMDEVQDLYNRAPCGYHSLDASGTYVRINDTELVWLGYHRDEVVGRMKFADLLTPASLARFRKEFPDFVQRGCAIDIPYELVRKNGTVLPVMLSATAIRDTDGKFVMSRAVTYDVTDLKRAEEKVNRLNAELEHRVELRTRQLEEANRELASFSYSMSHTLRTPLRSINGFSYALLRDHADKLDEAAIEDLQRVRAATKQMGRVIDDMVRLLRISRAELRMGSVNLSALAEKIVGELREEDPARSVEFVCAPGCAVRGDPALFRIVLENALENAWKYTGGVAQPKIEFGRMPGDGGNVYFVRDNGCGFDMQYAHKLFGAFQRLHPLGQFPGTGMGLASLHRALQRHGGRAWIEGAVGEGATLYFAVPGHLDLSDSPTAVA